jgi:hypothetical protein
MLMVAVRSRLSAAAAAAVAAPDGVPGNVSVADVVGTIVLGVPGGEMDNRFGVVGTRNTRPAPPTLFGDNGG